MQPNQSELSEILIWIKAACHPIVRKVLAEALPDTKSRLIYQLSDGKLGVDEIRRKAKTSPNAVSTLQQQCTASGLMTLNADKRRVRLFDLHDFAMEPTDE